MASEQKIKQGQHPFLDYVHEIYSNRILSPSTSVILNPPVLDQSKREKIEPQLKEIVRMIFSIPARIFQNNEFELGNFLGYSTYQIKWITFNQNMNFAPEDVLLRGDIYEAGPNDWRLLELNAGSNVGGVTVTSINRLINRSPVYLTFMKKNGCQTVDTLKLWAEQVSRIIGKREEVHVAIVEDDHIIQHYENVLSVLKEELQLYIKGKVVICSQKAFHLKENRLYYRNTEIHAIYRLFDLMDLERDLHSYAPVLNAWQAGHVRMPMGMKYKFLGNKLLFSILTDPQFHHYFTAKEKKLIEAFIPWTRELNEKTKSFVIDNRMHFVLKPADGYGGKGVYCGWDLTKREWDETIERLLQHKKKYVVQEKVEPLTAAISSYSEKNGFQSENMKLLWGIYLFDDAFAGGVTRAMPKNKSSVINLHNGASIGTLFVQ